MSVRINKLACNGCGDVPEPRCVRVCPGDLLYKGDQDGQSMVRDPRDCWDCAACVKECPRQAIEIYLPVQIGGRGSTLQAKTGSGRITWQLTKPDGASERIEIVTQNREKERQI